MRALPVTLVTALEPDRVFVCSRGVWGMDIHAYMCVNTQALTRELAHVYEE